MAGDVSPVAMFYYVALIWSLRAVFVPFLGPSFAVCTFVYCFSLSPFYLLGCGGKWINDWWPFVPFDSHCSNCQCAAPAFHDPSFGPASSSFHIADHYILPSLHHYICNITNDLDHYWSVIFISLGPIYVHGSGCKYETFLRLYCCDSGWWRYLINTNWWCQQGNPRQCDATSSIL